jgi:hypothetical protein
MGRMPAGPAPLGAISYEQETNWGEDVTTFATRLNPIGMIDASGLKQEKLVPDRLVQLRNEITPGVNGVMGGEFKTKFMLTGHGSTCNTTITLNDLENLLGKVIGNVGAAFSAANTTASGTGTVTAPNTVAANGGLAGALVRIGALNDGRGGGQFYVISQHSGSAMTLVNNLPATLINGDIIYNPAVVFTSEAPTTNTITGQRFLLQTANLAFECHGCYPKTIVFAGLNPGEEPSVEITWGVSWWRFATPTFPTVTSVQTFVHPPVAAGSFVLQTKGTATRATRAIRSFTLTWELGIVELKGPGGVNQYQPVVGCARTVDRITAEWDEDADANTATPDLAGKWDGNTAFYFLYSLACADGVGLAIFAPTVYPDGDRPVQQALDNLNRIHFKVRCGADNTKTVDRERSALRIALA